MLSRTAAAILRGSRVRAEIVGSLLMEATFFAVSSARSSPATSRNGTRFELGVRQAVESAYRELREKTPD